MGTQTQRQEDGKVCRTSRHADRHACRWSCRQTCMQVTCMMACDCMTTYSDFACGAQHMSTADVDWWMLFHAAHAAHAWGAACSVAARSCLSRSIRVSKPHHAGGCMLACVSLHASIFTCMHQPEALTHYCCGFHNLRGPGSGPRVT